MFRFPCIVKIQVQNENVTEKIIFGNTDTIYTSVEDPVNMHRTP